MTDDFQSIPQDGFLSSDEGRRYPEKALQIFLCNNPHALGIKNPNIVGSEYQTDVGRIDILVSSGESILWVVELKAGIAGRDAIGQITSYIGEIRSKYPERTVFGLLVAEDFDKGCMAAHKAIGDVELKKYITDYKLESIASMIVHERRHYGGQTSVIVEASGRMKIIRCPNCGTEKKVSINAHGVNCASCRTYIAIPNP